jgi:hypothetical protein
VEKSAASLPGVELMNWMWLSVKKDEKQTFEGAPVQHWGEGKREVFRESKAEGVAVSPSWSAG